MVPIGVHLTSMGTANCPLLFFRVLLPELHHLERPRPEDLYRYLVRQPEAMMLEADSLDRAIWFDPLV